MKKEKDKNLSLVQMELNTALIAVLVFYSLFVDLDKPKIQHIKLPMVSDITQVHKELVSSNSIPTLFAILKNSVVTFNLGATEVGRLEEIQAPSFRTELEKILYRIHKSNSVYLLVAHDEKVENYLRLKNAFSQLAQKHSISTIKIGVQ